VEPGDYGDQQNDPPGQDRCQRTHLPQMAQGVPQVRLAERSAQQRPYAAHLPRPEAEPHQRQAIDAVAAVQHGVGIDPGKLPPCTGEPGSELEFLV